MNNRFKFRVWDKGDEHYVDCADMLYIEPHRIQAVVWGIMHGFLYSDRCGTFFDKRFKIKEEK